MVNTLQIQGNDRRKKKGKKDTTKQKFLALGLLHVSFKTHSENLIGSSRHTLTCWKYDAPRAHLPTSTTPFFLILINVLKTFPFLFRDTEGQVLCGKIRGLWTITALFRDATIRVYENSISFL